MSRRRRAGNRYGRRMRLDTWDFSKRVGSSRYSRVTRTDSRAVSEVGRMIATKASPGFSRATSSTTSNPLSYCGPSSIMRTSQESSLDSLIACAVPSPSFRQSTNNVGRLNPHIAIKGTSRLSACRRTPFRGLIATLPRVCRPPDGHSSKDCRRNGSDNRDHDTGPCGHDGRIHNPPASTTKGRPMRTTVQQKHTDGTIATLLRTAPTNQPNF